MFRMCVQEDHYFLQVEYSTFYYIAVVATFDFDFFFVVSWVLTFFTIIIAFFRLCMVNFILCWKAWQHNRHTLSTHSISSIIKNVIGQNEMFFFHLYSPCRYIYSYLKKLQQSLHGRERFFLPHIQCFAYYSTSL